MELPFESRRGRVWVVDDSPLQVEALRLALGQVFEVETFGDGRALLDRVVEAGARPPEVLVVDWHMPEPAGLEVCQSVRRRFDATTLPIVIITASGVREDMLDGFAAGVNDFVSMPFDAQELNARVAGLIRSKRLADELREEALFRERFIGILTHDLRQPLNTMKLGSRALLRGEAQLDPVALGRRLANASDRMSRMVSDLLDLTRSRLGGGLPVEPRAVDLWDICDRIVDDLRLANPEHTIEMHRLGDDLTGQWDPDRLAQVCTNLVGNALDHGRAAATIVVQIEARRDEVVLSVTNEGESIPDEVLPTLFQPFRRAHASSSRGLGLGLFIVSEIARAHDGHIAVRSDARSTRFEITLPRRPRGAAARSPSNGTAAPENART